MSADFPRLLVATECWPNAPGGGAAIIRQMLKDWPAERLFWWSCFPERQKTFNREVAGHYVATIPPRMYPNPSRRWRRARLWLLEKVWLPGATRHFKKVLENVQPDAVWVIPHCWSIPTIAQVMPNSGIGFHVSVHDYADVSGNVGRFGASWSKKMAHLVDGLYSAATTRDSVCRRMVEDLHARTGRDGGVNRAGLEEEDFEYLLKQPESQNPEIRIAYAGTIIAEETFALFVKVLAEIRPRLPPVFLEFYGDHSYRSKSWFNNNWMRENGNLSAENLSKALKECDWGFSPMELTDDNARYNRFSLPTKFASYIAAGLPVIAFGHSESTIVKMASQYQVGLCITENDLKNLSGKLLDVLSKPNPRVTCRTEIRRCALAEFDVRQMRAVLFENFQKCAAGRRPGTFS